MSQNDISDIQIRNAAVTANTVVSLPIRGEKRIIPSPISSAEIANSATRTFGTTGVPISDQLLGQINQPGAGFNLSAALSTLTDYIMIRVQNRGMNPMGIFSDPTQPLVYRFLINPKTINVAHATLDSQTLTRSGWQFGVWGEDLVKISMSGSTAGQYFFLGLTDEFAEYSESYRNLAQLQMVFENNGYWFEGEQLGEGPLAASGVRRRIKMHNDMQLVVGDFIWYGCFETLQISQDAENPFLAHFSLEFTAWKERFRATSPYWNNIPNNVQRGHSYSVYQGSVNTNQIDSILPLSPNLGGSNLMPPILPLDGLPVSPAVTSEQTSYPTQAPTIGDFSATPPRVTDMDSTAGIEFWQA